MPLFWYKNARQHGAAGLSLGYYLFNQFIIRIKLVKVCVDTILKWLLISLLELCRCNFAS